MSAQALASTPSTPRTDTTTFDRHNGATVAPFRHAKHPSGGSYPITTAAL